MKARPILFSGPMVRALLAGSKTQTRRIVKPQPHHGPLAEIVHLGDGGWAMDDGDLSGHWQCPYGVPGDLLWVRERCRTYEASDGRRESRYFVDGDTGRLPDGFGHWDSKPRVSIHMPRWASRLTLEITDVRVERLNRITTEDAKAEGWEGDDFPLGWYADLWEQINGEGSWDANPWVWAVSFKVHALNVDAVLQARGCPNG